MKSLSQRLFNYMDDNVLINQLIIRTPWSRTLGLHHTKSPQFCETAVTWRTETKLMPDNFPAGLFLRKTDKCFDIYKVN